jgi:hypothetical protein
MKRRLLVMGPRHGLAHCNIIKTRLQNSLRRSYDPHGVFGDVTRCAVLTMGTV